MSEFNHRILALLRVKQQGDIPENLGLNGFWLSSAKMR